MITNLSNIVTISNNYKIVEINYYIHLGKRKNAIFQYNNIFFIIHRIKQTDFRFIFVIFQGKRAQKRGRIERTTKIQTEKLKVYN